MPLRVDGTPVAYASRALTEAKSRFVQIEKELLAATFACKKFQDFIYGRGAIIENSPQAYFCYCQEAS